MDSNATLVPNYPFIFSFEENFDNELWLLWFGQNLSKIFHLVIVYLIVVFVGQKWMSNKEPFSLRKPLFVWNSSLALFSFLGTLRTIPELYLTLSTFGFYHSVCSNSYLRQPVVNIWVVLFGLSKIVELGDTLFIILRKQRLIFLHWYHHITVLMFTWHAYANEASTGQWFTVMNYLVHSTMYSYYALRIMGIRAPKSIAMVITTGQIVQMVMGAFVSLYAMVAKMSGHFCSVSDSTVYSGVVMYLSYFVLFVNFFNEYYLKSQKNANKKQ